jgi:c-di-GMP-binding flagellar brake protein YcgR
MAKKRYVGFERRCFARIHRDFILDLKETDLRTELGITKKEEQHLIGKTVNISASGLLFETERPFALGTILNLTIKIPGWQKYMAAVSETKHLPGGTTFTALTKVIRNEELRPGQLYDIGVVFINIDPCKKQALNRYINDNS